MHDLDTFEGWLKHHGRDLHGQSEDVVATARVDFESVRAKREAARSAVFFSQPCPASEYRYAVAIGDSTDLRLALAVTRRLKKNGWECFILMQRAGDWNPHASYHHDGTYHNKSYDRVLMPERKKRQRLDQFRGTEHLGSFLGFGTGAAPICNPANFTSVVKVPNGILESMSGAVLIDLVEPGSLPNSIHRQNPGQRVTNEVTLRDCSPWLAIAVVQHVGSGVSP